MRVGLDPGAPGGIPVFAEDTVFAEAVMLVFDGV